MAKKKSRQKIKETKLEQIKEEDTFNE